jgi:hypothetical protein
MGSELMIGAALAVVMTIGAWALAASRDRLVDMPIGAGLFRGALVAVAVGILSGLILPFALSLGFPVDVGLGGYLVIGLAIFAIPTALGFFWVGVFLMPVGLLFTRRDRWPTVGTWLASTGIAIVIIVGYGVYQAARAAIDAPATATGTASFDIVGPKTARATGSGDATCTLFDDGTFRVDAGRGFTRTQPILSADGRDVTIQMVWPPDADASLSISIGDRASDVGQDGVMTIRDGSTSAAGTMIVEGILPADGPEPDPSDPWSGSVSWECPLR